MSTVDAMLASHPVESTIDRGVIARCIEACFECAATCSICADACLAEPDRETLLRCIALNQDCADVCLATGQALTRQTEAEWTLLRAQIQACVLACRTCGAECSEHAGHHEHCRICAEACRRCEDACSQLLAATLNQETRVSQDAVVEQTFPASDAPSTDGAIAPSSAAPGR